MHKDGIWLRHSMVNINSHTGNLQVIQTGPPESSPVLLCTSSWERVRVAIERMYIWKGWGCFVHRQSVAWLRVKHKWSLDSYHLISLDSKYLNPAKFDAFATLDMPNIWEMSRFCLNQCNISPLQLKKKNFFQHAYNTRAWEDKVKTSEVWGQSELH